MDTFLDVSGIVKRAKQALNFKKDSELASYLGVSRATLSNWCARNRIDFHLLLNKMRDVDLNWLLVGKGTPRHQAKFCESDLASGEVQMIHNPKTVEALDDRSVALYDITAAANLKTLLTNKRQYMVGKIQIPSIPLCDGAVYISGDSMYPILKSGDIVGFKEINSFSNLIYGEMYLVSFRGRVPGGEICEPLGKGRISQAGKLQRSSRPDGYPFQHHQCNGNREVLHPQTHNDVV